MNLFIYPKTRAMSLRCETPVKFILPCPFVAVNKQSTLARISTAQELNSGHLPDLTRKLFDSKPESSVVVLKCIKQVESILS